MLKGKKFDAFTLGSKANIVKFFGGKQGYFDAVKELEQNIYSIA